MRKTILTAIVLVLCVVAKAQVEDVMVIHHTDGSTERIAAKNIDYIDFTREDFDPYGAIDLGLSVKWAAYNVGATRPEELGDLFSWGETVTKTDYSEANYSYYSASGYQTIGRNIAGTKYDAARQLWQHGWRLPTLTEIKELLDNCTWTEETHYGVKGFLVTGPNGNSIFLPAAGYQRATTREEVGECGYYWTSIVNADMPSSAYNLNFKGYSANWTASRAYGFSIRAVKQ